MITDAIIFGPTHSVVFREDGEPHGAYLNSDGELTDCIYHLPLLLASRVGQNLAPESFIGRNLLQRELQRISHCEKALLFFLAGADSHLSSNTRRESIEIVDSLLRDSSVFQFLQARAFGTEPPVEGDFRGAEQLALENRHEAAAEFYAKLRIAAKTVGPVAECFLEIVFSQGVKTTFSESRAALVDSGIIAFAVLAVLDKDSNRFDELTATFLHNPLLQSHITNTELYLRRISTRLAETFSPLQERDRQLTLSSQDSAASTLVPSKEDMESVDVTASAPVSERNLIESPSSHLELVEAWFRHSDNVDYSVALSTIVRRVKECFNAEACSLFLVDRSRPDVLKLEAASTDRHGEMFNTNLNFPVQSKPGGGLTAHVAHSQKIIVLNQGEFSHSPYVAGRRQEHLTGRMCYSYLGVPLLDTQGRLLGVLTIDNKKTPSGTLESGVQFTSMDQYLVKEVATRLVATLEAHKRSVFLSCSHSDLFPGQELCLYLRNLPWLDIGIWTDVDRAASGHWKTEINSALERVDGGIILISPDFLASRFMTEVELPTLLDRLPSKYICPVLLSAIPKTRALANFNFINWKPLKEMSREERSDVWHLVYRWNVKTFRQMSR